MHFLCICVLPKNTKLKEAESKIAELMAPYCEEINGEWNEIGFWDWYQIGGRWTGWLDGYNPYKDDKNIETCWLCKGTGTRTDIIAVSGCNGCNGKGKRTKWPTQWVKHAGDFGTVKQVINKIKSDGFCYLVSDLGVTNLEEDREKLIKMAKFEPNQIAVVLDCHS